MNKKTIEAAWERYRSQVLSKLQLTPEGLELRFMAFCAGFSLGHVGAVEAHLNGTLLEYHRDFQREFEAQNLKMLTDSIKGSIQ